MFTKKDPDPNKGFQCRSIGVLYGYTKKKIRSSSALGLFHLLPGGGTI